MKKIHQILAKVLLCPSFVGFVSYLATVYTNQPIISMRFDVNVP